MNSIGTSNKKKLDGNVGPCTHTKIPSISRNPTTIYSFQHYCYNLLEPGYH